ncbi:MAG: hypothetical protein IKL44_08060, partial [Clostridia bacterium]|nr:hypothetical protein [Clostridia bacterium]
MEEKILITSKKSEQKSSNYTPTIIFAIITGIISYTGAFLEEELLIVFGAIFAFITILTVLANHKNNPGILTVTNKRVYGCTSRGERIDLPIDSITSVGLAPSYTIIIRTSSGSIKFSHLSNCNKYHKIISDMLIERQDKEKIQSTPQSIDQNVS